MTIPHSSITLRAGVLIPFIILSYSDEEVTTLSVRPTLLSPDYVPTSPDYSLDFDLNSEPTEDDSPNKDSTKTVESLPTHTSLTPETLFPPSLPQPSLLPSLSRKRSRSPSPPPPPPLAVLTPPPEYIELVRDNLRAVYAEPEVIELKDSLVTDRLKITKLHKRDVEALHARAEAAEQRAEALQASLSAAQINIAYLMESRRADRLEMAGLRTMTTTNQGMSFAKIKQIVAQRVANAIEAIAIYEAKTRVTRDIIDRVDVRKTRWQRVLATRGNGKMTMVEALANNKTKNISASFTTLAHDTSPESEAESPSGKTEN
ncbi:hypothetical protein Tco_1329981 [Tanacetum coccineum]